MLPFLAQNSPLSDVNYTRLSSSTNGTRIGAHHRLPGLGPNSGTQLCQNGCEAPLMGDRVEIREHGRSRGKATI